MPKYRVAIVKTIRQEADVVALDEADAQRYALNGSNISNKDTQFETKEAIILYPIQNKK